ncbi:MAG: chromosome segregation protein SMC [bacterium]
MPQNNFFVEKIELCGFKSFVDKTSLSFQPGVNAIVGPNGCGKSNLGDAIRWVLGEQSVKSLRGDKMEDVIFNGSAARKPFNMAEVSLKLANLNAENLPVHMNDVTITRRLHRSGESEYLLNNSPCRLKDISELFMDTGLGARSYALFEQGKVDLILSAKPKERRILIEEAAGLTKYKARKKETLEKLEATEQNLVRVEDIIKEVKQQTDSLSRQAKKAERYKEYLAEKKELELKLLLISYKSLNETQGILNQEVVQLQDQEIKQETILSQKEAEIEKEKFSLIEQRKKLSQIQEDINKTKKYIDNDETEIKVITEQLVYLKDYEKKSSGELDNLNGKKKKLIEQADSQQEELKNIEKEISSLSSILREKEAQEKKLGLLVEEKQKDVDLYKGEIFKLNSQLTQFNNELRVLNNQLQKINHQEQKLQAEEERLDKSKIELSERVTSTQGDLDVLEEEVSSSTSRRDDLKTELEERKLELSELEDEIDEKKQELTVNSSRLHSLKKLQDNLEGYSEGVKAIVREGLDKREVTGVCGILADLISTEPKYERAIEAVLEHNLQAIILEKGEDALKAINYLKIKKIGRCTFIPLLFDKDQVLDHSDLKVSNILPSEELISAIKVVKCNDKFHPVVTKLLNEVAIADNLTTALDQWFKSKKITVVTIDGEVLHQPGIISGGSAEKAGLGILSRNREIKELGVVVHNLTNGLNRLKDKQETFSMNIEDMEDQLTELDKEIHHKQVEGLNVKREVDKLNLEVERVERHLETIGLELEQFTVERADLEKQRGEVEEKAISLKEKTLVSERELNQILLEHKDSKIILSTLKEEITNVRVKLSSLHERKRANISFVNKLEKDLKDTEADIELKGKDINSLTSKQEEAKKKKVELEKNLKVLYEDKRKVDDLCTQKREYIQEVYQTVEQKEQSVKQKRKELDELKEKVKGLELKRAELNNELRHLQVKAKDFYDLQSPEQLEVKCKEVRDLSLVDPKGFEAGIEQLKQKIDNMGAINLIAIDEYNQIKERYDFLTKQQHDLIESIDSLKKVIAKIDTTTKEKFLEAFTAINEHFKAVYTRLFEGGYGELRLTEETAKRGTKEDNNEGQKTTTEERVITEKNDLQEAGLDILVQPPGKRLQSLSILSGGEKALTAIALLFAVFLYKPSPFCFFDEVDAPLDEANINRFTAILREFADRSQFVVVTHNKRTMEAANVLYGVTMENSGVSKIISVRLNEGG